MHGWAKQAKKHWPKCMVIESKDQMDIIGPDGVLVSASRDGNGGMQCNQKASHAMHSLAQLQDPSWSPSGEEVKEQK